MADNRHFAVTTANVAHDLGEPLTAIEVINRSSPVTEVYFTVDGTAATVGGNNTYVLPAVVGYVKAIDISLPDVIEGRSNTVINVIGQAAGAISVEH